MIAQARLGHFLEPLLLSHKSGWLNFRLRCTLHAESRGQKWRWLKELRCNSTPSNLKTGNNVKETTGLLTPGYVDEHINIVISMVWVVGNIKHQICWDQPLNAVC
jgi:hypothetical protein